MTRLPDWQARMADALAALDDGSASHQPFLEANGEAVARALTGLPVDGGERRAGHGGCVVVNMAALHLSRLTREGMAYKNCYDLDEEGRRVGRAPTTSPKRRMVDEALEPLHGETKESVYFAAIEFNGCGIGFYGDCCLVLEDEVTSGDAILLDRNSYDLIREPLRTRIADAAAKSGLSEREARAQEAAEHAGELSQHLAAMAAIKVLESRRPVSRLVTTGAVSGGVLDDEDYLEVLRRRTFDIHEVREVRLSPADVALDERIRARSLIGEAPSQAEALWRGRRRRAEARLRAIGIPVRVVTTAGRTKG